MTILEAALKYLELGYSIIPVGKDKKPLIKWEHFQKERVNRYGLEQWLKKFPDMNIGVVTGAISNLTTIDCDSLEAVTKFEELAPEGFVTATQVTPRGGRHFVCRYNEGVRNLASIVEHMDVRSEGGYIVVAPSSNGVAQYEWLPGFAPWEVSLMPVPRKLLSLIRESKNNVVVFDARARSNEHAMFTQGTRAENMFYTACCLIRGNMPDDDALQVLYTLGDSCNPPYSPAEVDDRFESAKKHIKNENRNLAQDIRDWLSVTSRDISVTMCDRELQIVTKEEKANRRQVFKRLVSEGELIKDKDREGLYRKPEKDLEKIDYLAASGNAVDLHLPLGLDRLVRIMPKNIIVCAGEPNAGKTAWLLNVAYENQNSHEIHYFSSEMGPDELKERLVKFQEANLINIGEWKTSFWDRAEDFSSVIHPDAINIIDFLELYDEFWKSGALIKDIWNKLNRGVAIIALQKNPTQVLKDGSVKNDWGLSGLRAAEKARLYFTMSTQNIAVIKKAKNWKTKVNPNNMHMKYSLAQGCVFREKILWTSNTDFLQKTKYQGIVDQDFPEERE